MNGRRLFDVHEVSYAKESASSVVGIQGSETPNWNRLDCGHALHLKPCTASSCMSVSSLQQPHSNYVEEACARLFVRGEYVIVSGTVDLYARAQTTPQQRWQWDQLGSWKGGALAMRLEVWMVSRLW